MYMVLHTFKDYSCFQNFFGMEEMESSFSSSTYAISCAYFTSGPLFVLNHHTADHRNDIAFELMFHAIVVVASQRNGLRGISVADFVRHFIRELDVDFNLPERLIDPHQVLDNFEENVVIPFFPTIKGILPEDLSSMENVITGKFEIVGQVDGIGSLSNGGLLILECKNWKDDIGKGDYKNIVVKAINHFIGVQSSFNLHLLCANAFAVDQMLLDDICIEQDETFVSYAKRRSLRFYHVGLSSNVASLAQSATFESSVSYSGIDLFLIFCMKELFPKQDFSFLPPKANDLGKHFINDEDHSQDEAWPLSKALRRSERLGNQPAHQN